MIARFLGAVQFLTTVLVRGRTAAPGASAAFFPLIGGAIGIVGAAILLVAGEFLPLPLASILVLGSWALITGGLHEDGFADVADAFRSGRPRERIQAIMKDSRIGAHGALALILITLLRWHALSAIAAPPLLCLPATLAVSRGAMIALAWITPPVGSGLGFDFSRHLTSTSAVAAIVLSGLMASVAPAGLLLVWGACLVVIAARTYFMRRVGGVNGDCLGATALLVETWGLVLYSCQRCM
jgi:adenosylcobinamide-GDP ribazoletransferase